MVKYNIYIMHKGEKLVKKLFLSLLLLIIIAGLIGGGIYINKYKPSDEVIGFSDEIYLMVEDILVEDGEPVVLIDDILYFSFDIIKTYFDEDIYYDDMEETLILTNKERVKRFKVGSYEASINSKEYLINHPVRLIHDKVYLALDLFEDDYEIEVNYYPNTNAVVVDYTDIYYLNGEVILFLYH